MERLKDPEIGGKIRSICKYYMETLIAEESWDDSIILYAGEGNDDLIGKSFAAAAEMRGVEPIRSIGHAMSEDDLRTILKHPLTMVSTDGSALPLDYSPDGASPELRDLPQDSEEVREAGEALDP